MVDLTTLDDYGEDDAPSDDGLSSLSRGATGCYWDPDWPNPEVQPMSLRKRVWVRLLFRFGYRFDRLAATYEFWRDYYEDEEDGFHWSGNRK